MGRKKVETSGKTAVNFQVDTPFAKKLHSQAHREERSLSSLIRYVLKKYIEQQEKKEKRKKK